ncbi:MAG: hypothetical protein ACYDBQ_10770 [Thermoplasmatota archaeon]
MRFAGRQGAHGWAVKAIIHPLVAGAMGVAATVDAEFRPRAGGVAAATEHTHRAGGAQAPPKRARL